MLVDVLHDDQGRIFAVTRDEGVASAFLLLDPSFGTTEAKVGDLSMIEELQEAAEEIEEDEVEPDDSEDEPYPSE